MKHKKSYNNGNNSSIPEELLESIIRVAYKDAGLQERIKIKKLAETDESVRKVLEEYRATAESVHSIQPDECPAELLEGLREHKNFAKPQKPSLFLDFYTALFVKPYVTAATVTVLLIAIVISISINRSVYYDGYETAEVEKANRQAKYALSIVGKVFKSTTNSLANEILTDRVSKPINEGIKTVNNLFKEEEEIK